MAEAMAAAGLASSIVAFIDASVKLASVCKEFHSNYGELPKELAKCQKLTDEFYLWISDLQRSLSVQDPLIQPTEADSALQNVIVKCVDECKAFQELLSGLLPAVRARNQLGARLAALKSAVSAMHKEGKIKRCQQSLEQLKNDLRLYIGVRTMRLSEQALNQNKRNLEVGEQAMNIQSEGQREVVAYMIDHRTRLEDMSNKLGWLEINLQRTDRKSDEVLLLVRELASSANSRNDDTAIICISIPRSIYNPSLSIYNGFRACSPRLPMPGSWVSPLWDFRPFHSRDNGIPSRVAFISIGSNMVADEDLAFEPKKVSSEFKLRNSQLYRQQQGWLSWLLCFAHTGTVIYPVTKSKASASNRPDSYKVWHEAMEKMNEPRSAKQLDFPPLAQLQNTSDQEFREGQARAMSRSTGNLDVDDSDSIVSGLKNDKLPTVSASDLEELHEIITIDPSIEGSAKKQVIWGIKLVEEQNWVQLFIWQFFIAAFLLFLSEPWKLSFYVTLRTVLHDFLMTSWINYHGILNLPLLVLCRTIIALVPFVSVLFELPLSSLSIPALELPIFNLFMPVFEHFMPFHHVLARDQLLWNFCYKLGSHQVPV